MGVSALHAQEHRIFHNTPDTVALWEFNDLPGVAGGSLPDGTVMPDLSSNGHDVVVKNNTSSAMRQAMYSNTCTEDTAVRRTIDTEEAAEAYGQGATNVGT